MTCTLGEAVDLVCDHDDEPRADPVAVAQLREALVDDARAVHGSCPQPADDDFKLVLAKFMSLD